MSWWIIVVVAFYSLSLMQPWNDKKTKLINWDVTQYYIYLPATFIYQDLKQEKNWGYNTYENDIAIEEGNVFKMTSGVALLQMPFFLMAHSYALLSPDYPSDGFSLPYQLGLSFGSLIIVLLGLWFLRKFLLYYFSENIVSIILMLIFFGTNLWYFSTWSGGMSHGYSFTLVALSLFLSEKYLRKQQLLVAAILGLAFGLIVLIRPVNLIIVATIGLYLLVRLIQAHQKIAISHLVLLFACALLAISPQLFFWKYVTGDWIYYSYQGETFFFSNPQILKGLFSFRKGWLIYTPIMAFSLVGFLPMFKQNRTYFYVLVPLFTLFVFVTFSWWCWWYGGSFGQRAFIEAYPLLAIPLGYFLFWVSKQKLVFKALLIPAFGGLIFLNIFQSYQRFYRIMHYDGMTMYSYRLILLKTERPPDGVYWSTIKMPDYEKARRGEGE